MQRPCCRLSIRRIAVFGRMGLGLLEKTMGEYTATVVWQRAAAAAFTDNRYSRAHRWEFDGGAVVPASSSPQVVPLPLSDATAVDPEEAFVASLASCHMLFFLSIVARAGFIVEQYQDRAVGLMARTDEGRQAITQVTLHPAVTFAAPVPDPQQQRAWHHRAHEQCFIAASVRCAVLLEPAV